MKNRAHLFQNKNGLALLMALWALLTLSAIVFAFVRFIEANTEANADANFSLEARMFAHSGVQVAMHPNVTPSTPLLQQMLEYNRGYRTTLTGEAGRIDLNYVIKTEAGKTMLDRYLQVRGVTNYQARQTFIDSLLYWTDPNAKPRPMSPQDSDDYHPRHGPIASLDEVKQIHGSEVLTNLPNWDDDFTLWGKGPVDLQWASLNVIESLPNVSDGQAARFIEIRNGPDKTPNTNDDMIFQNLQTALSYLGISAQSVKGLVTVGTKTYRAVSVGQSGNRTRQVVAVFNKAANPTTPPQILYWKES